MATKLPKFENEDEEARWWYDHREEIAADLVAASRAGALGEGTVGRQARRRAAAVAATVIETSESGQLSSR